MDLLLPQSLTRRHEPFAGPIIRITPTELHINDPEFYDQIYSRNSRRDKYSYFSGRFGYASDSFSTIDHDVHRLRRKPLNPMFSAKRIGEFQPVIRENLEKLCQKIAQYQKDGQVVPLNRAWMAVTTDIITEYAFAESYNQVDSPNFQDTLHEALVAIYTTGQFALHFPIVFPILDRLPEWFVLLAQPALQPVVGLRKVSHFGSCSLNPSESKKTVVIVNPIFRTWLVKSETLERGLTRATKWSLTQPSSTNSSTVTYQPRRKLTLVWVMRLS